MLDAYRVTNAGSAGQQTRRLPDRVLLAMHGMNSLWLRRKNAKGSSGRSMSKSLSAVGRGRSEAFALREEGRSDDGREERFSHARRGPSAWSPACVLWVPTDDGPSLSEHHRLARPPPSAARVWDDMAESSEPVRVVRVVAVSPSDVTAERERLAAVVQELDAGVAQVHGYRLKLWRWETDAHPGLHVEGPQGLIDDAMRIEDADVVVGIFWTRFGTPTQQANSGTEHELRCAWSAWQQRGRPQVMVYFCERKFRIRTAAEAAQLQQLLEFRDSMPREQLWWSFAKTADFDQAVRRHLTSFILALQPVVEGSEPVASRTAEAEPVMPPVGDVSLPPLVVAEPKAPPPPAQSRERASELETFEMLNDYREENAELRQRLSGYPAEVAPCFPRLNELDNALERIEPQGGLMRASTEGPRLDELAGRLHATLAAGDAGNSPLHYDKHDVNAFVAGLAMSRLHILEGDSGTGKTSLAVRAAQLLGGYVEKIDVQAGWRNSDRLIGNYNSLEHRYEEEPFMVAVYRAGAPQYSDQIVFIVLDEMNLSPVEYYLTSLLSKLEDAGRIAQPITLELMPSSPRGGKNSWPDRLGDGRLLTVPPNVWFIGTANRDESTHTITDTTYDRAAILQLERVDPSVKSGAGAEIATGELRIGFNFLEQSFARAGVDHPLSQMSALHSALRHIDASLKAFSMRWSPRFMRQLGHFVPVYVACGGTAQDAADHLLATKVLRRLRDRYDNQRSELEALQEDMRSAWTAFDSDASPRRSLQAIDMAMPR